MVDWTRVHQYASAGIACHNAGMEDEAETALEKLRQILGLLQEPVENPHPGNHDARAWGRHSVKSVKETVLRLLRDHGAQTLNQLLDRAEGIHGPSVSGTLTYLVATNDVKICGSTTLPGSKKLVNVYALATQEVTRWWNTS